jgi:ADP-ribose pyrophosphatase YjhB (NUDIX family)
MSPHPPSFYHPAPRTLSFCSQCGTRLNRIIPPDDNRMRDVCENCGAVHYQNPLNVVGVVPVWENKILLCRRAIEPRHGKWTLPAGFMELGESTGQGAMRETLEESGVSIRLGPLFTVINVPHAEQVHFFYLADVLDPALDPGPETLEAAFFSPEDIPWEKLAFHTIRSTLEHFVADSKAGAFGLHHYEISAPYPG